MTRKSWLSHRAEVVASATIYHLNEDRANVERGLIRDHVSSGCKLCDARRRTIRSNRLSAARADAMRGLGMVRTRHGWE